ncbi:uncharacterized protein Z518_02094 [Rhinocladiella mackenziei CBS 650.93]|uniref:Magnesium transporter n=1 Tax=Rhinocladiella mackenziei CBS 650.93 TaxID=1442369 RepID=A0A0D2IW23_9EURO|nr:uncharacterized protein Z518_02094 [Rhinocladiella mackenziei CBS 650.93]KIX07441.1 hypothetical protein Z518_02094 [Rhinocladiella mackenziei CBS 650.93]
MDNDDLESDSSEVREHTASSVAHGTPISQSESPRISLFLTRIGSFIHAENLDNLLSHQTSFRDASNMALFTKETWWLDILNPTDDEIDTVSETFSLHQLTTEDIKTREAVEKVESFKQYYFCSFRSFYQDNEANVKPTNLYVVVLKWGVVTFAFGQSQHAANVRKRIGKLDDGAPLSGHWICYALIDDIIDSFGPVISRIERETSAAENSILITPAHDSSPLLRQIYRCRNTVMALLGVLRSKATVIKGFARQHRDEQNTTGGADTNTTSIVAPRDKIDAYLDDIQDHVVTMMSDLDYFENTLSRLQLNYQAQLSTYGLQSRRRTIRVLGRMAAIGGLVMGLNVVCGLFGMNVPVPGGGVHNLFWWFGIFAFILVISAVSLVAIRIL